MVVILSGIMELMDVKVRMMYKSRDWMHKYEHTYYCRFVSIV
jgi:hypothetical protein